MNQTISQQQVLRGELSKKRKPRGNRYAQAAREGMSQAWRDWWSLIRNPLFWALAFVMWLAMNYGRVG